MEMHPSDARISTSHRKPGYPCSDEAVGPADVVFADIGNVLSASLRTNAV
jgi:hypothetical protein